MVGLINISEKSGISKDYIIAFGSLDNYLRRIEKDEPPRLRYLAKRAFIQRRIQKYEEYFSSVKKSKLVIDKNREAIQRLNDIVDKLNRIRESESIDDKELSAIWNEINDIIFK